MSDEINDDRRRFLGTTAVVDAEGFATTRRSP
jgi:hypothetical protein